MTAPISPATPQTTSAQLRMTMLSGGASVCGPKIS
jgi:hypothetical protein